MNSAKLIRLEWGRLRRDRVFWLAMALGCLALWYGLANGAAWMRFQQQAIGRAGVIAEEHIAAAKTKAAALAGKSEKEREGAYYYDPSVAMVFESEYLHLYDCLPPSPLALVSVGQSDLLAFCIRVRVGPWPEFSVHGEWENPLRLLLGRFDCAFAVIYLLPLLALMTSFDLLAREKELGTLPL
ncbi:MAG: ABC transporter permease subunit, partial [Beijerinckiaceae bacterium]|nr:ABC transporter permease subunit [Beijerinckiaceae bacterium]